MSSSKQVKIQQRLRLSERINREGVEMPACSHCSRRGTKCVVSGDSRRCSECVTRNARCEVQYIISCNDVRLRSRYTSLNQKDYNIPARLEYA
jgi:hypothetical protein